jgi:V/A-type H+-transporting ATPase subunit A
MEKIAPDWRALRTEALTLLQRDERCRQIAQLVGPDALPEEQRLVLFICEIIKDGFLTQSAFDEKDAYCSPERQAALLRMILGLYRSGRALVEGGVALARIKALPCVSELVRAKSVYGNGELAGLAALEARLKDELGRLHKELPAAAA